MTEPPSIATPYWIRDDLTIDPDVTLEGSSAVDRIVASSTSHDWGHQQATHDETVEGMTPQLSALLNFLRPSTDSILFHGGDASQLTI